jgi:hypothetical protein
MKYPLKLFIIIGFLIASKFSFSANIISTGDYELAANATGTINISIANDVSFSAFQFDLVIPEHFTLDETSVVLAGRENGHILSREILEGNILRVIAYSETEEAFTDSSGAVVQFALTAGNKPGNYPLTLQNVIIASGGVNIMDQVNSGTLTLRAPEITLTPESIDFGEVPLLQQESRNITIQNTGNSTLNISGLEIPHPDYSLNDENGFVLAANSSVSRTVNFNATEKGIKTGKIKVYSDCPANPISEINVTTDAFAVNEIHLSSVAGRSGYAVTLPISINNMEPFTGFQFEINLPEQVMFIPGSEQLSSRATDHQITADTTKNKLIVTAWSNTNANFLEKDGEIATVDLYLEGNGGYYSINFSEAIVADSLTNNILSASYGTSVRIKSPSISLTSDNYDFGQVSVTDSAEYTFEILNYGDDTLKVQSISCIENSFTVSEKNYPISISPSQMKNVTVKFKNELEGDYSGRLIIRNNDVNNDPIYLNLQGETFEPNELHVLNDSGKVGELNYIDIKLENYSEISAFQFDLILPEGFSVVDDSCALSERSDGHSLDINNISSNTVRFISYSGSLKNYSDHSGIILHVALITEQDVPPGIYNLQLQNVVLSNINSKNVVSNTLNGQFTLLTNIICQNIYFQQGWNIFSAPVYSDPNDMKSLFQSLIDNSSLVKIQDELGNSLEDRGIFGGWQNEIGDIDPAEGYKINVNVDEMLEVCGVPVEYPFEIPLQQGWNIIGFPRTESYNGMDIVERLIDNGVLIKVQDESGNSIEDRGIFGGWQNDIGNFDPGKGYKIKVNVNDTLLIYETYPKSAITRNEPLTTTHFKPIFKGNGVDHMNINIVTLPVNQLQPDDELAVFDGNLCVGSVTLMPWHLNESYISIAASASDEFGMPGFAEGNVFIVKLWNSKQNREYELEFEILKGTATFLKHESTFISLEKFVNIKLEDEISADKTKINCYPNPFSEEITIEISLDRDAEVQVEILNQLGQQVKILATKQKMVRGTHHITWNGQNAANLKAVSGMYYLRVNINGTVAHRKIVLSK